jgi:hypothetical protein
MLDGDVHRFSCIEDDKAVDVREMRAMRENL